MNFRSRFQQRGCCSDFEARFRFKITLADGIMYITGIRGGINFMPLEEILGTALINLDSIQIRRGSPPLWREWGIFKKNKRRCFVLWMGVMMRGTTWRDELVANSVGVVGH